jgi:hypothetical protein
MHADGFARAAAGAVGWPLLGQPQRGLFKALDGLWGLAGRVGAELDSNRAPAPVDLAAPRVLLVDEWPRAGDSLVSKAASSDGGVRVEARRRPDKPDWPAARGVPVTWWEDDAPASRLGRPRGELLPPARRLAESADGVTLAVEPAMLAAAERLVALTRRRDIELRPVTMPAP